MEAFNLFFDANCFTSFPQDDFKAVIDGNNNFIITPVLEEVRKGQLNELQNNRFDLLLNKDGILKKEFNEISLSNCDKDYAYKFEATPFMFLKKNPVLCSAYYTWLTSAASPAIVNDVYRHAYNEILFEIKSAAKDEIPALLAMESAIRVRETQTLEKVDESTGRKLVVKRPWLLRSRKKKIDDVLAGKFLLADCQLMTTALLYGSFHGKNVSVWTCDRDIVDIKDNLYKSIIERYAVYELLKERIEQLSESTKKVYQYYGIEIDLEIKTIQERALKVMKDIAQEKNYLNLMVVLYRQEFNKVFQYPIKIPAWLRDFILSYKKNIDCISLYARYENLYNITYIMHPDFIKKTVNYKINMRHPHPGKTCIADCHAICKYPRIERDDPSGIGEFIDRKNI